MGRFGKSNKRSIGTEEGTKDTSTEQSTTTTEESGTSSNTSEQSKPTIRLNSKEKEFSELSTVSKKQRKPRETKADKEKSNKESVLLFANVFGAGSSYLARVAGEHWLLTQHEAYTIADPLVKLLDKYNIADGVGKYKEEIAMLLAVGTVVLPKIMMSMKEVKKEDVSTINQSADERKGRGTNIKTTKVEETIRTTKTDDTVSISDDVPFSGQPTSSN